MPTVHQRRKSSSSPPSPFPHPSEPAGEPVLRQGLALTSSDVACLPCLSVAAESHAHLPLSARHGAALNICTVVMLCPLVEFPKESPWTMLANLPVSDS